MRLPNIYTGSFAVLGSIINFAFGTWSEHLTFLLVAMGVDIVTGMTASLKEGRGLSSSAGSIGLSKKGGILLVILLSHRIDILLEISNITMMAAIYFYIANELVSITENFGRNGIPLPNVIKQAIAVLKNKGGINDDNKTSN